MYPILFEIPLFNGIPINTYGLLVAIGYLLGIWWISMEAKRMGKNPNQAVDLAFYTIVAAVVGARVLYVVVEKSDRLFSDPLYLFKIWEGGLVFYGGLIAAMIVSAWQFRRHKLDGWLYADMYAPGIALGHAIGRIGCFMAGCCFGRHTSDHHWYSVIFPFHERSIAPSGVALYPTQLMESAGVFILFLFLFFMRTRKKFNGEIVLLYTMGYALIRSSIEIFRGDIERGFIFGQVSTSQFISMIYFGIALVVYFRLRRKSTS